MSRDHRPETCVARSQHATDESMHDSGKLNNPDAEQNASSAKQTQQRQDGSGGVSASPALESEPVHRCSNCGAELNGNFCAICGQPNRDIRRPLYSLLAELLHVLLDIDGRAYRTLYFLFTRPAYLTSAYIRGMRANYTSPLRLFLAISILFFVMISAQNSINSLRQSMREIQDAENGSDPAIETREEIAARIRAEVDQDIDNGREFIGSLIDHINIPFLAPESNANLHAALRAQAQENYIALTEDPGSALQNLLEYITPFMLLMIPILAFMQFVVFFPARRYFIEHLVLTLHNHAFIILSLLVTQLLGYIQSANVILLSPGAGIVSTLIIIWMPIYLLLSLKRFFEWNWFVTIALFVMTSIAYAAVMGVGIAIFALTLFILS